MSELQPSVREDLIDFVIVSRRSIDYVTKILIEASHNPTKWGRHNFIVVYDDDHKRAELRNWVAENYDIYALPHVTVCTARPGYMRDLNALRQQGLEQGINKFVYFQDDDDALPEGLDRRMRMMENSSWLAVFGITQTESNRGQVIEEFPVLTNGSFMYEPLDACKLFPIYVHPQAALFKRELFKQIPIQTDKKYNATSSLSFMLRLCHSGLPITFLPDVVRHVSLHSDNDTGILNTKQAEELVEDIVHWHDEMELPEDIQNFQKLIARNLSVGTISTYREIAAQVEAVMDEGFSTLS